MPNLTPAETLRRFEQSLVPVRAVAGCDESFDKYEQDVLPSALDPVKKAAIQQGFDAGYAAAMDRVRGLLMNAQTEALHQPDAIGAATRLLAAIDDGAVKRDDKELWDLVDELREALP